MKAPQRLPHGGKAATQRRILESAARLFLERGYDRTTTAKIASGAGVSRATIFWHFGNKAGLFREVFTWLLVPFRESVDRDLGSLKPEKQLEQRVASYQDFVHQRREIVLGFMAWVIESPCLRREVVEALMDLHRRYAQALTRTLKALLREDQDPARVAEGLMAMLHGNLLLGLFDASETAEDRRRANAGEILALIANK